MFLSGSGCGCAADVHIAKLATLVSLSVRALGSHAANLVRFRPSVLRSPETTFPRAAPHPSAGLSRRENSRLARIRKVLSRINKLNAGTGLKIHSCGATLLDAFASSQRILHMPVFDHGGASPRRLYSGRIRFLLPSKVHSILRLSPQSQRLRLSVHNPVKNLLTLSQRFNCLYHDTGAHVKRFFLAVVV